MIESNGESKPLKNDDLNIVASDEELDKDQAYFFPEDEQQVIQSLY